MTNRFKRGDLDGDAGIDRRIDHGERDDDAVKELEHGMERWTGNPEEVPMAGSRATAGRPTNRGTAGGLRADDPDAGEQRRKDYERTKGDLISKID